MKSLVKKNLHAIALDESTSYQNLVALYHIFENGYLQHGASEIRDNCTDTHLCSFSELDVNVSKDIASSDQKQQHQLLFSTSYRDFYLTQSKKITELSKTLPRQLDKAIFEKVWSDLDSCKEMGKAQLSIKFDYPPALIPNGEIELELHADSSARNAHWHLNIDADPLSNQIKMHAEGKYHFDKILYDWFTTCFPHFLTSELKERKVEVDFSTVEKSIRAFIPQLHLCDAIGVEFDLNASHSHCNDVATQLSVFLDDYTIDLALQSLSADHYQSTVTIDQFDAFYNSVENYLINAQTIFDDLLPRPIQTYQTEIKTLLNSLAAEVDGQRVTYKIEDENGQLWFLVNDQRISVKSIAQRLAVMLTQ